MKYTNTSNLPDALFRAISNDSYTRGDADISVTQLIAPPRQVALETKHADELSEDVIDRVFAVLGQAVHTILERANVKGVAERRLSIERLGWKISGAMDLYDEGGVLIDYKVQSFWRFKDGVPEDVEAQLNIYAQILRDNGYPVKALKIVAILRDWSKSMAERDPSLPQKQVIMLNVPLWGEEKANAFILERVEFHRAARELLPLCTDDERWTKDEYAVMRKGAKRATKLFRVEDRKDRENQREQAAIHASTFPDAVVIHRQDSTVRCNYCSVSAFCSQYVQLKQPKGASEESES